MYMFIVYVVTQHTEYSCNLNMDKNIKERQHLKKILQILSPETNPYLNDADKIILIRYLTA